MTDDRRKELDDNFKQLKELLKGYAGKKPKDQLEALLTEIYSLDDTFDSNVMRDLIDLIYEELSYAD